MTSVRVLIGVLAIVTLGVVAAAVLVGPEEPLGRLPIPGLGEVRPDYLADGTPVWVIGHDDGSVDVLSGFDTHRPSNVGKVLWWCVSADGFENPEHGAQYDEYGRRLGGPAPTGLPPYSVTIDGGRVVVGELQPAPPYDAPHTGAPGNDREWCHDPAAERIYHTFEGWQAWSSPTDAVAASPDGWILLEGHLALADGAVVLCARDGCADSAVAANVDPTDADREFGPLFGDRFIAQVHEGELVGVTRVRPADPP